MFFLPTDDSTREDKGDQFEMTLEEKIKSKLPEGWTNRRVNNVTLSPSKEKGLSPSVSLSLCLCFFVCLTFPLYVSYSLPSIHSLLTHLQVTYENDKRRVDWENELARHILSMYATTQAANEDSLPQSKIIMDYVDPRGKQAAAQVFSMFLSLSFLFSVYTYLAKSLLLIFFFFSFLPLCLSVLLFSIVSCSSFLSIFLDFSLSCHSLSFFVSSVSVTNTPKFSYISYTISILVGSTEEVRHEIFRPRQSEEEREKGGVVSGRRKGSRDIIISELMEKINRTESDTKRARGSNKFRTDTLVKTKDGREVVIRGRF